MNGMIPPDRGQVNDDDEMSRGTVTGRVGSTAFTRPRVMQGRVAVE
ncbi:MAG: hypothetical protein ABSB63_06335 [Spirochaetia bacterium]